MALVRILVDGYSLLHNWTELAPGKPRYSAAAREDLIAVLTQYHDACGTPITVVFDGSRSKRGRTGSLSPREKAGVRGRERTNCLGVGLRIRVRPGTFFSFSFPKT